MNRRDLFRLLPAAAAVAVLPKAFSSQPVMPTLPMPAWAANMPVRQWYAIGGHSDYVFNGTGISHETHTVAVLYGEANENGGACVYKFDEPTGEWKLMKIDPDSLQYLLPAER
jgi:hypothetical protein